MAEEAAIEQYGEDGIEVYHAYFKPLEFTIAENEVDAKSCYMKVANIGDIIIIINSTSLFIAYNDFRFVLGYRNWPTLNTQWHRLSWTYGVLYLPARCPLPDDK